MRRLVLITAIAALLLASASAECRPDRGFNEGPYLDLLGGAGQFDFDYNQATQSKVGGDFEPLVGIIFGWNALDQLSAEIQARYTTNKNSGQREHIANANLYAKWMPIFDALTDFQSLRILPFVKGGMGITVAVVPGGDASTKMTMIGFGPSVGGGIAFLWKKYVHFGIDVQEDFLYFGDQRQTVGSTPDALIYKSGFFHQFSGMGFIGVHY
jgi:hypothetical protein